MDEATTAEANQAQTMLHRVSPQGRAEARRQREARARRVRRLAAAWLGIAAAVFLGYWLLGRIAGPFGETSFAIATGIMLLGCLLVAIAWRERPVTTPSVGAGELPLLPARTQAWVATQRPALPAPAVTLLDGIGARIASLEPQIARLEERGEPADALRRLLGTELPGLVDQYRAIPTSLRGEARADGTTPDARLLHGLGTVDRELADLTRRLGGGAADGLSTHDRFLDSKYGAGPAGDPLG